MVKHVESADEFDALKKASKPVRPTLEFVFSLTFVLSLLREARDRFRRRRRRVRAREVFLSRSLFL
jgi:hypothetical protein